MHMLKRSSTHTVSYRFMFCYFGSHWHANSLSSLMSYSSPSLSSSSSSSSCSSKEIQKQFCVMWVKKFVFLSIICFWENKPQSIRIWCRGRHVLRLCPRVFMCALMFILQTFALYYSSRRGTMCTFPLVDVFVSFVPYFFISLPPKLFRCLGICFPFHFLLGILP